MEKLLDGKVGGLILSAGLSSRINGFKPLLKYKGQYFITSILQKVYPVCDKVCIVTGYKKEEVNNTVNNFIIESNFNKDKVKLI